LKKKDHTGWGGCSGFISSLAAIQFLLVTPAFIKRSFSPQELGHSIGFYPLVGLILGLILVGANWLLGLFFPDLVRTAILLGVWVILTGAFHLDGFLDSCDGLLGGSDPEHRLQIMRDERVGAFALAGGILLMLIKFSALYSLETRPVALILAPVLGRWMISLAIVSFPYARREGLGRAIKDHASRQQAILATIFTLSIAVGLGFFRPGWTGAAAIIASVFSTGLIVKFSLARLPGLTGDLYGAICEVAETSVLVALSAL
jgi:adenosylcobinamide-GDP ribazoletransferase